MHAVLILPDSVNQIFPQFPAHFVDWGSAIFLVQANILSTASWQLKFNLSKETQGYTQNFAMEINLGFNNYSSRMRDIYL